MVIPIKLIFLCGFVVHDYIMGTSSVNTEQLLFELSHTDKWDCTQWPLVSRN